MDGRWEQKERMSRPRGRLASSTSLTRCSSLSRLSSSSSSAAIAVRNEEEHTRRMYKCLIAAGLLQLASVTFLQLHLVSSAATRQGSTNLDSLQNDNNHLGLFLSDKSAGDAAGGELLVSDDEERGFFKLVWSGRRRTSQRNAAAAAATRVGVESNTGTDEEDFETGEELVEEEEEEEEEPPADRERLLEAADMVSQVGHKGIGDMAAENVSSESVVISHDDDELLVQNKADDNASQFMQQQNEKFGETMRAMGTESRNGSTMKLGRTIALDGGEINIVDKQPDHGFKMDTGIMLGAGSKGVDVEKHEAAAAMVLNMAVVGRVSSSHHQQHLQQGFKEFIESWKEQFDSDDDDFLDEDVHWRQLEDVVEIEDGLLLSDDGAAVKSMVKLPLMTAGKVGKKKKKGEEGSYNSIINPVDIPMLQDPDTGSGPDNWMTKSDEAMLNALRVDGYGKKIDPLPSRFLLRGLHVDSVLHEEGKEQEID
ncbi:unnamed protein product [Sphagnum jensenii]|uniref:Uncharacterized protein n=1 Tax=Sphagnum jensenii TaxID=128206 RepID=A0ABP1ASE8_9BRYO